MDDVPASWTALVGELLSEIRLLREDLARHESSRGASRDRHDSSRPLTAAERAKRYRSRKQAGSAPVKRVTKIVTKSDAGGVGGGSDSGSDSLFGKEGTGKKGNSARAAKDGLPEAIDTPDMRAAWSEFEQHRREGRYPLTPTAVRRAQLQLARLGPERAVAALQFSVANGYRGIFEPSDNGSSGEPVAARSRRTPGL